MSRSTAALNALACLVTVSLPLAAQDPWSKVPAFPTACYDNSGQGFHGAVSDIRHELVVAGDKQREINSALREKLANLDVSEQQSRMMAFMMKDPATAGAKMQEIALAGQKQQQALERLAQTHSALAEQLEAAEAQYAVEKAALDAIQVEYSKVAAAAHSPGDPVRAKQIAARYDAEYQKMCAKWLVAESSPLLKYLASKKSLLIKEQIPGEEERASHEMFQLEVNGIPTAGFKSAGVYTAVVAYLDDVTKVFGRRHSVPLSAR